jgi:hypothetical protein
MRPRLPVAAIALAGCLLVPTAAYAGATVFLGRNSGGDDRSVVRGLVFGASLSSSASSSEYANSSEDLTEFRPALRTTSGNVLVQTFDSRVPALFHDRRRTLSERLGTDEESAMLSNGGGGKVNLAGPLRVRIDYRVFNLKENPRHRTVQRIYAAEPGVLGGFRLRTRPRPEACSQGPKPSGSALAIVDDGTRLMG